MVGIKGYLIAAFVLVALVASCGILRNWDRIVHPRQPREPRVVEHHGKVESVLDANHLTIDTGNPDAVLPRRRENLQDVTIQDIVVVGDSSLTKALCPEGSEVTVRVRRSRLLGEEEDAVADPAATVDLQIPLPDRPPDEGEGLEARGPLTGVVIAQNGEDVGLRLIMDGVAKAGPDAPKEYKLAEKNAKYK